MKDKALALAAEGCPVFPCAPSKRPLVPTGFKAATTDPATIERWWSQWPDALIGVPTGEKFVVVDCDLQHAEGRQWFDAHHHTLPTSRTHHTRLGGRHLLFKPHPGIGCSTSRLGPHIDTRGLGGYIIWWPAHGLPVEHPSVLADVPEDLIKTLAPPLAPPPSQSPRGTDPASSDRRTVKRAMALLDRVGHAPQGNRNATLYWACCRFAEMYLDDDLDDEGLNYILGELFDAALRTGLQRREISATIKSGTGLRL